MREKSTALTFLIRFLPSERIFNLDIPARDIILSILFVDRASLLQKKNSKSNSEKHMKKSGHILAIL